MITDSQKLYLKVGGGLAAVIIVLSTIALFGPANLSRFLKTEIGSLPSPSPSATPEPVWLSYDELLERGEIEPAGQILFVGLAYDSAAQPLLTISNVQKMNGYVPTYDTSDNGYTLEVLDTNGAVIQQLPFTIPNEIEDPHTVLDKVDFALTLDWVETAQRVQIVTPNGEAITSKSLADVQVIDNQPNFETLVYPDTEPYSYIKKLAPGKALANSTNKKLDIVLIGDDYTKDQLGQFDIDAKRFIDHFFTIQPFKSRKHQIAFHRVRNIEDLKCRTENSPDYPSKITVPTYISCSDYQIGLQIGNARVPYDKVGVIINDPSKNSGAARLGAMCCAKQYNSPDGHYVFVHEMAHLLNLIDEYLLYVSNGAIIGERNNCHAGAPEADRWKDVVSCWDYAKICEHPNWSRPYKNSIMSERRDNFFNGVSQQILKTIIDRYTDTFNGGTHDIKIISPKDQSDVSGTVEIKAQSSTLDKIVRVNFRIDDTFVHTVYEPNDEDGTSFVYEWNTTRILACGAHFVLNANGQHTLTVDAYDAAEKLVSSTVTVNIDNPTGLIIKKCTWDCINNSYSDVAKPIDGTFDFNVNLTEPVSLRIQASDMYGGEGSFIPVSQDTPFSVIENVTPEWKFNYASCENSNQVFVGTPTKNGITGLTTFSRTLGIELPGAITCTFINTPNNPVPSITTISPQSAKVGDPGFYLTINGTNFVKWSRVFWNGSEVTWNDLYSPNYPYISATQLKFWVNKKALALPGSFKVTVVNQNPPGEILGTKKETSNVAIFTVIQTPTPTPTPSLAESCATLIGKATIHCSSIPSPCAKSPTGAYICPAGQVCDFANLPLKSTVPITCGNNSAGATAKIDAMCQRLEYVFPIEDGELDRSCREVRVQPVAEGGFDTNDPLPYNRALTPTEEKKTLSGNCSAGPAACIGKSSCTVSGFEIQSCGDPKPLDDREQCKPEDYRGFLTVSCKGQ